MNHHSDHFVDDGRSVEPLAEQESASVDVAMDTEQLTGSSELGHDGRAYPPAYIRTSDGQVMRPRVIGSNVPNEVDWERSWPGGVEPRTIGAIAVARRGPSPRCQQVLAMVSQRLRAKQIAAELGIAPSTVETYLRDLKRLGLYPLPGGDGEASDTPD